MMIKPKVSLVKCLSYSPQEVESAVEKSLDLLGGIEQFVKPGETVLLKPNLLTDALPQTCIDTHPQVVRGVIRRLKTVAGRIYCGDAPSVWGEPRDIHRVYDVSGIKDVCLEEGIELVSFTTPKMRKGYLLTDWLDTCDRFISVPKFKTHGLTILTGAVKNLYGLVVGMYKMKLHRDHPRPRDFARILLDIYEAAKPDLTILDGVTALEGDGPGSAGTLKQVNLIAASSNAVALDTLLAVIMGVAPLDIVTNREAFMRGLGGKDIDELDIVGEDLKIFFGSGFKLPSASFLSAMPEWALDILKFFLRVKPQIITGRCKACGVCQKGCPVGAISRSKDHVVIDYKKCILCLCCQEFCPYGAIDVKKSLLLRLKGA